jgi:hypothetical protein
MDGQRPWQLVHTIILAGVVLAFILIGVLPWPLAAVQPESRLLTWWVIVALFVISLGTIGHGLVGRPLGAFIDQRNRMSLSRLQLVVWTIAILSGFLTIALWNLHTPGNDDPLNIGMPEQLWWLLGISTTSLVGSPLIKGTKTDKPGALRDFRRKKVQLIKRRGTRFEKAATEAAPIAAGPAPVLAVGAPVVPAAGAPPVTATGAPVVGPPAVGVPVVPAAAVPEPPEQPGERAIGAQGQLVVFSSPDMASPADLFGGEETGNVSVMDMGKVQMFYFTVILVLTYTMALLNVLGSTDVSISFPEVNQSMVALLGISHAGYLATKAASHSPTEDTA